MSILGALCQEKVEANSVKGWLLPLALTLAEREQTSRNLAARRSLRCIARTLGRPASTVSREIERKGGKQQLLPHSVGNR